jgi:hypothetical protein
LHSGLQTSCHASPLIRLLLLLIALGHVSSGGTIVSVSGPLDGGYYPLSNSQVAASSWTSPRTYTGVTIAALLTSGVGQQGTAYLTTQIGPGTTTASEIARDNVSFPSSVSPVTLFSNLTLLAGTYYLVLSSPISQSGGGWRDAYDCGSICSYPTPTITLDLGVVRNTDFLAAGGSVDAYAPASGFHVGGGIHGDPFLQYSVVAAPEPAIFVIVGSGLLALTCMFGWRRKPWGRFSSSRASP